MKRLVTLSVAFAMALVFGQEASAGSASYGFRGGFLTWNEDTLLGDGARKADGLMFGPTFVFRFGDNDQWAAGIDGAYGALGNMDRADCDLTLTYQVSTMFGVFADMRYSWYNYDGSGDADLNAEVTTSGIGLGVGLCVNVPVGESGTFVFANTRIMSIEMSTDVPGADGTPTLWAYEGGAAYAWDFDNEARKGSLYVSAGYRYQQMKGGEFDETIQLPFVEAGFKQEF